jgi:hypothetical protein
MPSPQKFMLCASKSGAWTVKHLFVLERPDFFIAGGLGVIGQLDDSQWVHDVSSIDP